MIDSTTAPATSTTASALHRAAGLYSRRRSNKIAARAEEIDAKWLHRIAAAEARGDHKKAFALRRQYIRSFSGKVMALEQDDARRKTKRKIDRRRLIKVAEEISAWHPTGERVRLQVEPKRSGGYRPIFSYGLKGRGLQILLRRAAAAGVAFHPAQMSVGGRGGQRDAIELAVEAVGSGEFTHAIELDIKDCFSSLTLEGMARVAGLPPRAMQNVAMATRDAVDIITPGFSLWLAAPGVIAIDGSLRGIAQGSLCAPTIANIVLKPLLEHVPESAFAIMWVDNLLVLTRSKAEAERIRNALCAAAGQLPSGSLRMTCSAVRRLSDGKTFLGTVLRRRKGITTAEPTAATKNKFTAKAKEVLSQPPSAGRDQAYCSLARGFEAQHRLWSDVGTWTTLRRFVVEAHLRRPDRKPPSKDFRGSCFMVPALKDVRRVEGELASRRALLQSSSRTAAM